jgi:ribosome-associated translation inhibitor RaiA
MQWFDPATGDGAVVRGGGVFAVAAPDVESGARRAGAHVHFDIRDEHGSTRAVNVTLRRGGRSSPRHRRAGSLTGTGRPDTKGGALFARAHPGSGLSRTSHPLEVASAWARCLRIGDLDTALSLYASDAIVHVDGDSLSGRSHLHAHLERSGLLGGVGAPEIRGEDGLAVLTWHLVGPKRQTFEVRCRIEHGHVVEQWFGVAEARAQPIGLDEAYEPPRMVVTRGRVGDDVVDYARQRLGTVIDQIGEPVWLVRVKLSLARDAARQRPALAQVTIDVDGDLVRAQVAARDLREAVDLLQRRLRDQLEHRAQHRQTLHRSSGVSEAGEWRRGDLPEQRPEYFDRAPEERQLVRHKTFAVGEMTPDEAAFDMGQLDYDFYLFSDLASGEDALLAREHDDSYRLTLLHPTEPDPSPIAIPLAVSEHAPPTMTVDEAIESLDAGHLPFVFFANASSRRGNVVYRRYDGHDGLITPE